MLFLRIQKARIYNTHSVILSAHSVFSKETNSGHKYTQLTQIWNKISE